MTIGHDADGPGFEGLVSANGTSTPYNHSVVTGGSTVYADVFCDRATTLSNVACGGGAMTAVGTPSTLTAGLSGNAFIQRYKCVGVPSGAQAISAKSSAAVWMVIGSVSYTGVGSEGSSQTANGTGHSASQTPTLSAGSWVLQSFAGYFGTGGIALFTVGGGANRFNGRAVSGSTGEADLAMSDATSSTTFTASDASGNMPRWGGLAHELIPAAIVAPSGISSAEAFGALTVADGDANLSPSSIPSAEAVGAPTVGETGAVLPGAIPSGEAFGAPVVTPGAVTLSPTGIGSREIFGAPWINGPGGPARAKLDLGQDVVLMNVGDSTGFGAFDAEPPATPTTGTTKHGSFGRTGLDLGDEYDCNVVVKQFNGTAWGSETTLRSSVGGSSQKITLLSGAINSQALVNQESFLSTNLLQYAATADVLIMYEGINDVDVSGLDAADFVAAYQHFIGEVQAAEPNLPIVITTENPTTYTNESQFAANFSALATAYVGSGLPLSPPLQRSPSANVWVLDTRQAFNGYTLSTLIYSGSPTVHPNYLGYKVLADWMSSQLFGINVGLVAPTGIDSAEAFGSATVTPGSVDVDPSGIASGEAFGTAAVGSAGTIAPAGIPTAEAFGSPAITTGAVSVAPVSIGSAEAFGVPTVAGQTTPSAPTPASRTLVVAADSRTLTVQP